MTKMTATWSGFSEEEQSKIKAEFNVLLVNTDNNATNNLSNFHCNQNFIDYTKPTELEHRGLNTASTVQKPSQGTLPRNGFSQFGSKQEKASETPNHVKLKIVEDSSFEIMETTPINHSKDPNCNEEKKYNQLQAACIEQPILEIKDRDSTDDSSSSVLSLQTARKHLQTSEDFEKQRKIIEEQNKLRKQMLAKALAMRKMKAHAEAQKLHQIQEELTKLDISLSNDVSILRNHIELASAELADAEKRYSKAEREYVEAKQLLFSKRERKDLLTEHLNAIIEQNEIRRAHRLTDLMVQLSEEPTVEITLNQVAGVTTLTDDSDIV